MPRDSRGVEVEEEALVVVRGGDLRERSGMRRGALATLGATLDVEADDADGRRGDVAGAVVVKDATEGGVDVGKGVRDGDLGDGGACGGVGGEEAREGAPRLRNRHRRRRVRERGDARRGTRRVRRAAKTPRDR